MKSIIWRVFGICKSHGLVVLSVLLAFLALVISPSTDIPPAPFAHLDCEADGLPDLEVVCSTRASANFRTGELSFDGDDDPIKIETIVSDPPPRNWFKRFWGRIWGQDSSETSTVVAPLKEVYHHRYEKADDYEIELIVTNAIDERHSTKETVTVKNSPELEFGELVLTDLVLTRKDYEGPTHSFEYRIDQAQYENRMFVDTMRRYTRIIKANEGWKLIDCAFDKGLRSRRASYERSTASRFDYSDDWSEAEFSFRLTSKRWLFDGRDAWLHGVAICRQQPINQASEEQVGRKEELRIKRTGVIEVNVGSEGTTFEARAIRNWSFKHDKEDRHYNLVHDRTLTARISSQKVELSIVDPPMLELEERRSKVWLKVSQIGKDP